MRLKLDENLPVSAAEPLRERGHDVDTVHDEALSGSADPHVIAAATAADRALITLDKGLADVRTYPPENYAGIVLLRPKSTGRGTVLQFVIDQLPQLPDIDIRGAIDGRLRSGHSIAMMNSHAICRDKRLQDKREAVKKAGAQGALRGK